MKTIYLALLIMLLSIASHGQRFLSEVFPSYSKTSNITYASNISILSGTPTMTNLQMDVYQPAGVTDTMAKRPLVILLHSGSFLPPYFNGQLMGNRVDSGLEFICKSFARRGYVVANIDYRLGWAPTHSSLDIRRGTIILAAYRAVQDVKAAVRFFRKDAATANTYMIDPNRVIVGGEYTGGLVAMNFAVLTSQSQVAIPKFISNITDASFGFIAGLPYIRDSIVGDLDGYGGIPAMNNPNNSPGYSGKANFVFGYEGVVGDSSWVTSGLPPMVFMHRIHNQENSPYGHGVIAVQNPPNPPLFVVDVSGSGFVIPRTNARGNNASFNPNGFTDPYTLRANAINGGQDGLFPVVFDTAAIAWFDSTSAVTECQAYGVPLPNCIYAYQQEAGHTKPRALAYIDTLMNYVNPRIVKSLFSPNPTGIETPQNGGGVVVYPNPSKGEFVVSSVKGIDAIIIKDLSGRLIRRLNPKQEREVQIRLTGFPSGLYIVTVQCQDATITRRVVLQ
jgi:acetyl esterase/lipase